MMNAEDQKLVATYLEGTEECAALDEALCRDEDTRVELLTQAAMDVQLKAYFQAEGDADLAGSGGEGAQPQSGPLAQTSAVAGERGGAPSRRRWLPRVAIPLGLAAGLALLCYAVWLWQSHRPAGPAVVQQTSPSAQGVAVAPPSPPPPVRVPAPPPPEAVVRQVQGEAVLSYGAGERGTQVTNGTAVLAGGRLRVGARADAYLAYADGSVLHLYRNTALMLGNSAGAKQIEMQQGAVDADVVPQPLDRPMTVMTPYLLVRVVGTELRVLTDAESSWAGVRSGKIEVVRRADGKTTRLTSGQYSAVAPNWPFMVMYGTCPNWQGHCQALTGDKTYLLEGPRRRPGS